MGLVLQRPQKPKRKVNFLQKNRQKHILCVQKCSDEGGALEEKGIGSSLEDHSEQDSEWTSSDVDSGSTDFDVEEILPFHCDECGRIFKSEIWFQWHLAKGVHKKPAVGMKAFVYKRMQF